MNKGLRNAIEDIQTALQDGHHELMPLLEKMLTEFDKEKFFDMAPRSFTEIRGEHDDGKNGGGSQVWTPRDALINTLRELDQGALHKGQGQCEQIVICLLMGGEDFQSVDCKAAVKSTNDAIGILERAKTNYLIRWQED